MSEFFFKIFASANSSIVWTEAGSANFTAEISLKSFIEDYHDVLERLIYSVKTFKRNPSVMKSNIVVAYLTLHRYDSLVL